MKIWIFSVSVGSVLFGGCANNAPAFPPPSPAQFKNSHSSQGDDPVGASSFVRTPLSQTHPLLGAWQIALAGGKCIEEYDIRADGTKVSSSGEERNESEFRILPSARGLYWYEWTDKIVKNNRKPDCMGSFTAEGHEAVNYVIVHPNGQRFALCKTADMNNCYAEFFRRSP
ncbi:hypothetical protein GN316_05240 [Xylophilus sp. Kf1]|nr:hypothetical protein [Xylophilus sp. Kf1]